MAHEISAAILKKCLTAGNRFTITIWQNDYEDILSNRTVNPVPGDELTVLNSLYTCALITQVPCIHLTGILLHLLLDTMTAKLLMVPSNVMSSQKTGQFQNLFIAIYSLCVTDEKKSLV